MKTILAVLVLLSFISISAQDSKAKEFPVELLQKKKFASLKIHEIGVERDVIDPNKKREILFIGCRVLRVIVLPRTMITEVSIKVPGLSAQYNNVELFRSNTNREVLIGRTEVIRYD